jgi:hypothetical protein
VLAGGFWAVQMAKDGVKRQREVLAATYGQHVPLRMQMESEILSQYRRLPTLQSSMIGLDTLAGRDTQINLSDVFGEHSLLRAVPLAQFRAHTEPGSLRSLRFQSNRGPVCDVCHRLRQLTGRSAGRFARRYGSQARIVCCPAVDKPSWWAVAHARPSNYCWCK